MLSTWNVGLALGAVAFRTMEAIMYTIGVVSLVCLLAISRQYADPISADAVASRSAGEVLLALREQVVAPAVLAFSVGALMYHYRKWCWRSG